MRRAFGVMLAAAAVIASGLALTPSLSAAAQNNSVTIDDARPNPIHHAKIHRTEVCFTVHNIGDLEAHQVSGTLFHTRKRYTGGGTALLLQHGAVAERSSWDGGRPRVTGAVSMIDVLVPAGYDVFAVDRLGFGKSPYRPGEPGTGWALTMDAYAEMTHEMVTQIREGTFRISETGSCEGGVEAGRVAPKVVLMGYSSGAAVIELYATRYHDIDGIVPLMWSNQGSGKEFGDAWVQTVTSQWAQGKDYVYLFPVGPDGYSQACEHFLVDTDGVSEDVIKQLCGPEYYGGNPPPTSPSGEQSTVLAVEHEIKLMIGEVGPTPVLLVFADGDLLFPNAQTGGGEPDTVTPEIKMWKEGCNCDVEVLWQENAGHAGFLHDSASEMTASIVEWLRSHSL